MHRGPAYPLALALLTCACAGSEAATQPDEQKPGVVARGPADFGADIGFRLAIPSGYEVTAFEGADFSVYSVSNAAQTLLRFYAGNRADFPSPRARGALALTMVGQIEGACLTWSERPGRYSRDCLVALDREFPAQLHLWYFDLSQDERDRVESMLDTLASTGAQ